MTRIIAVANQKGGTGKSTTAVNLAHGLTLKAQNVLLVDFDSQGSATLSLGLTPAPATYQLLMEREPLADVVMGTERQGLHLLASDATLADVRDWLGIQAGRNYKRAVGLLNGVLSGQVDDYDFVIIDCGPGLDMISYNAIAAADEIMVPVSMDFLSAAGTRQHLDTIEDVQKRGGNGRLAYVVPTKYDGRLNRSKTILELLQNTFGELVTEPIRNNTRVAEAPHYGQTIFEHDSSAAGAVDYAKLTMRVLNG